MRLRACEKFRRERPEGKARGAQVRAENLSRDAIGSQVITALKQLQAEILDGALVTIEPNRTRIRILPLRK